MQPTNKRPIIDRTAPMRKSNGRPPHSRFEFTIGAPPFTNPAWILPRSNACATSRAGIASQAIDVGLAASTGGALQACIATSQSGSGPCPSIRRNRLPICADRETRTNGVSYFFDTILGRRHGVRFVDQERNYRRWYGGCGVTGRHRGQRRKNRRDRQS